MKATIGILALLLSGGLQAAEHFLEPGEIENLKPHPDVPGVSRYITPGADPGSYEKIMVGGVTFYFAEKSKTKDIDADEMKKISDAMKAALVSAAVDKAEVVLSPGPNTALINVAITEINMQNKKRGLLGYTPIGLVASTAGNLAGMRIRLRGAKLEGEVVDSVTGDVISIFRVDEVGNFDDKKGMSWEDLRATLETSIAKGIAAARAGAAK